jgi:hypothetical protein
MRMDLRRAGRKECPLLGVKRTCRFALHESAIDPKRTLVGPTPMSAVEPVLALKEFTNNCTILSIL